MSTLSVFGEVFGATIRVAGVPESVERPLIDLASLQANAHEALLHIEGVARFHVADGREVVVQPDAGVGVEACAVWLHGIVAGLVLAQQRRFALHASTVRIGGTGGGAPVTIAIAGGSGAGKSTTAAALSARGHTVITDEVSVVDLDHDRPTVHPSPRQLRLRPETARRLALDNLTASDVVDPLGKKAFVLPATAPSVLDLLVVLRRSPLTGPPVIQPLGPLEGVKAMHAQTYRRSLARLDPAAHHVWATTVARRVRVVRLHRPDDRWSVDAVLDAIEQLAAERAAGPDGSVDLR